MKTSTKRTVHQPNFDHRHTLTKRPRKRPPYVLSPPFLRCWMFGVRRSMFPSWFPRSALRVLFPQVPAYSSRFNRVWARAGVTVVRQSCKHSAVVPTQTVVLRMRSCLVVPNRMGGGGTPSALKLPSVAPSKIRLQSGSPSRLRPFLCDLPICPKLNCPPPLFPALFAPLCSR
jgi:hypothetical protein